MEEIVSSPKNFNSRGTRDGISEENNVFLTTPESLRGESFENSKNVHSLSPDDQLSFPNPIAITPDDSGHFTLRIGDTNYQVIPGSVAYQDLFGGGIVLPPDCMNTSNESMKSSSGEEEEYSANTSTPSSLNNDKNKSVKKSVNKICRGKGTSSQETQQLHSMATNIVEARLFGGNDKNQVSDDDDYTDNDDNIISEFIDETIKEASDKELFKKPAVPPSTNKKGPSATPMTYKCAICGNGGGTYEDQKSFYLHLKKHYEPSNPPAKSNKTIVSNAQGENVGDNNNHSSQENNDKTSGLSSSSPTIQEESNQVGATKYSNKYQCDVCQKPFLCLSNLKAHKRIHSGIRPFKCPVCSKAFRQLGDLQYHTKSIHENIKDFKCEFCGKEFSRKYSLTIHRRIHNDDRPYVCEFCNKGFRAAIYLKNHRRVHTKEKPYPCNICGRSFRVRPDMTRHRINVHLKPSSNGNFANGSNTLINEAGDLLLDTGVSGSSVYLATDPGASSQTIDYEEVQLWKNGATVDDNDEIKDDPDKNK